MENVYTSPDYFPLFSLLRDRSEMKMKSNCAVFSRQLLHHGNQPDDPAVLVEQFFMDNKKDLAYLISDEAKRNLINVIVSGNIYVLIYLTGSALIYAT